MAPPSLSAFVRRVPREWAALGMLSVGLLLLQLMRIPIDLSDAVVRDSVVTVRLEADSLTSATLALMHGSWERHADGIKPADSDAELRIECPRGPWRRARLDIIGDQGQRWGVRLGRDNQGFMLPSVRPGETIDVPPRDMPGDRFSDGQLAVRVTPTGQLTPGARLAQVHLRLSAEDGTRRLPAYPGIFFGALLPVAFTCFLLGTGRRTLDHAARFGGIAGGAAVLFVLWNVDLLQYTWIASLSFFLGGASGAFFRGMFGRVDDAQRTSSLRLAEWSAIGAVIGLTLFIRWGAFEDARLLPLRQDAEGYVQIAREGTFYETTQQKPPWVREPLFPALLRAWFAFAQDSDTSARFFAMWLGLGPVLLTFLAGRKLFSPLTALIASGFIALNPFLAELSVSAMREDTMTTLFLLLLSIPLYMGGRPWARAGAFGIVGALLVLTRLSNLLLLVPLVAIEAARRRWRPAEVALVFLIAVPPVVPHLAFNAALSGGDPFYSTNVHTRYYLNRLNIGQPGFPATLLEWTENPYAGPRVSNLRLLVSGGVMAGARRVVAGYAKVFLLNFPHGELFRGREWPMLFGLVGAWALWRRREAWWAAAWFLIALFPIAVIAPIGLDYRLAATAAPMILLVWGAGVEYSLHALRGVVGAGRKKIEAPG